MAKDEQDPARQIKDLYRKVVLAKHPTEAARWPILSGANHQVASYRGWLVFFFKHTGNPVMTASSGVGELSQTAVGVDTIDDANLSMVHERLYRHFRAGADDALVLIPPSGNLHSSQLHELLLRHETALGLTPMRVFLSHKSPDKTRVRDFKSTLELLGFQPWLDEDAMAAGAQLDRAILTGMQESCAAVFFLTPHFADEAYLASEINYAVQEHRARPGRFAIITLVLPANDQKPDVPGLLRQFVWKEPRTDLEALREITRALPIRVGEVRWR